MPMRASDQSLSLSSCFFVFLDLEATGKHFLLDRITQFASASTSEEDEDYCSFVYTPKKIPVRVQNLNGITRSTLQGAKSFASVATAWLQWIEARATGRRRVLVVAHNGLKFDFPLLFEEWSRYGLPWERLSEFLFLDSLEFFRELHTSGLTALADIPTLSLANIHVFLTGSPLEEAHDALADSRALRKCFLSSEIAAHLESKAAPLVRELEQVRTVWLERRAEALTRETLLDRAERLQYEEREREALRAYLAEEAEKARRRSEREAAARRREAEQEEKAERARMREALRLERERERAVAQAEKARRRAVKQANERRAEALRGDAAFQKRTRALAQALSGVVGRVVVQALAVNGLTYARLRRLYREQGSEGMRERLQEAGVFAEAKLRALLLHFAEAAAASEKEEEEEDEEAEEEAAVSARLTSLSLEQ